MGFMIIDGRKVEFTDEKNILTVIRKAGIDVPTLCYHSELSTFGACRLCTVEDDRGRTFASCSEEPRDGMVIYTNSEKVRKYRKLIVELLLAAHCRDCTTCIKSGECVLQELAHRLGVKKVRFQNTREERPLDFSSPAIVRDPNKCILCGNCVRVCDEIQGIGAIDFAYRGTDAMVMPAFDRQIAETDCVNCGQCRVFCPTGAITIRTNIGEVWKALADKDTRVVAQIAPAVRVAAGDAFGLPKGENAMGKIVAALHRMGFDEVFDTSYSADLTIMEESAEFLKRLEKGENLPLLTSCCPAWVKFVQDQFPDYKENISTCRSPQQMFSAVIKEYYRNPEHAEGKKTVVVSIMPCTAKKMEAEREEFIRNGKPDIDAVLTTKELASMIRELGIQFADLEPTAPDTPFSIRSGGGVIFGTSGGVTEAALRRLAERTNPVLQEIRYSGVRGLEGIKKFTIEIGGKAVHTAVVSGLGNAEKLIQLIESGEEHFDFVEVMACPTGCIGGAGQPESFLEDKKKRSSGLYTADKSALVKRSDENPVVTKLYEDGVLKDRARELLHVHYKAPTTSQS